MDTTSCGTLGSEASEVSLLLMEKIFAIAQNRVNASHGSSIPTRPTSDIYTIFTDRRTTSGGEPGTHTGDHGQITIAGKKNTRQGRQRKVARTSDQRRRSHEQRYRGKVRVQISR